MVQQVLLRTHSEVVSRYKPDAQLIASEGASTSLFWDVRLVLSYFRAQVIAA